MSNTVSFCDILTSVSGRMIPSAGMPEASVLPTASLQVIDILTDKAQKGELDKTYTDAVISCYVKRSDNVQTEDGEKNFHFDDNATQSTSSQDNVTQNGTAPTSANQNNEKEGREQ